MTAAMTPAAAKEYPEVICHRISPFFFIDLCYYCCIELGEGHYMSHLVATEYKCFEDIRRTRSDGSEYWYARELASVLD